MSNWKTIDELRDIFIKKYTESKLSSELEKACSEEYELMRDYNGRQILELLQNVDDAYGEKKKNNELLDEEIEVKITYKNNILEVGNTGTTFTKETIERLCLGRASSKSSKNIGNKGTGFRSLLNDAEMVELYSGEFAIRFSEAYAAKCFEEVSDIHIIKQQHLNWKKDYRLCFPTMNCPEAIKQINTGFDTLIRLKLKEENQRKSTSIANQLQQTFYKALLFLPNITKIIIEIDDNKCVFEKVVSDNEVLIETTDENLITKEELYYVFDKEVEIGEKTAVITVAVPQDRDYDFNKEKLYCYFPIRNFSTPIHALINAPFITNNSRDDVPDDSEGVNRSIFEEIMKCIKEIAEKFAMPKYENISTKMVSLFSGNKLWDTDFFGLKNRYLEILSDAKILRTVNDEYISIKDNPKVFKEVFPKEFLGENFKELLKKLNTNEEYELIENLSDYIGYDQLKYSSKELSEKINRISNSLSMNERIKVFIWWSSIKQYREVNYIPKLLLDSRERWIEKSASESKVFLPTSTGVSILPTELSWVELVVLNQEYCNELISQVKKDREEWEKISSKYKTERTGDKRLLDAYSEQHLAIEFTEQSSLDIIISSINRQVDSVSKCKTFINWIFKEYGQKIVAGNELSKIQFKLPDVDEEIRGSNKLFLGSSYNNELGEKLFCQSEYYELIGLEKLFDGDTQEAFVLFLQKCGVLRFPQIKDEISLIDESDFKCFLAEKYRGEITPYINYLYSPSIDNFRGIIKSLQTEEIVNWIKSDEDLRGLLYSNITKARAAKQRNSYGDRFLSNEYIKFILNTTKWIEIDDKKYAPKEIVFYDKLKDNVKGIYGIAEDSLLELLGKDILQNLDFKESMACLEDDEIKNILDCLPSFDRGEISRKLYIDIIKHKKNKKPKYSTDDIKILAKDSVFYNNNEARYADKKVPKLIEEQRSFIAIQAKQSSTTILNWFGVEKYKSNLILKNYIKASNNIEEFSKEIVEIKTAVLSTIAENKENVERIKRLQVIPCSELVACDVEQENSLLNVENYYFVNDKSNYYLKLPTEIDIQHLRSTDDFAEAIVDIFRQVLTLEINSALVQLLISKDAKRKVKKISDEFGIDKWKEAYELLFKENPINKEVVEYFMLNGASQEILNMISNVDFTYNIKDEEYPVLISALKEISKDVSDINHISEQINLELRPYFMKEYKAYLCRNSNHYINSVYTDLVNSRSINKQNYFLKLIDKYNESTLSFDEVENSVSFNVENIAVTKFSNLGKLDNLISAEEEYYKNYDEMNPTQEFSDEIALNKAIRIMIYFNRKSEFKQWIRNEKEKLKKNEEIDVNDVYKGMEGLLPEIKEIEYNPPNEQRLKKKSRNRMFIKKVKDKEDKNKKERGNKGERIVYNFLVNKYGKKNVFPRSEAFVEMGILRPGQAVSGEYDLSYKDEDGTLIYVEVKTTGDGQSFIITPGELEFAKKNPKLYKVLLVDDVDGSPNVREVPTEFWNDEKFRMTEVVERIKVEF